MSDLPVSMWFTQPRASGPRCVNHIETDTERYNQLVPWATCLWQRIDGLETIASAIKGSSTYLATVKCISVADHRWSNSPNIDDSSCWHRFCSTLVSFCHSEPWCYRRCMQQTGHCVKLDCYSYSCLCELLTRWKQSIATPKQLT